MAGAVFALLQADLFSRLTGIINDKRLCKTLDKKSAPIPGGLKPVLIVDPKRYVQCLHQNKAVEHWYISIGTFQKRMQPRFACYSVRGFDCLFPLWGTLGTTDLPLFSSESVMLTSISKFHTGVVKTKGFKRVSVFRRLCSTTNARFSLVCLILAL